MFRKFFLKTLTAAVFFAILSRCIPDAPHDNPLDPVFSISAEGLTIHGVVYSYYQPYQPISDVLVSVPDAGYLSMTDESGSFILNNLQKEKYTFILQKENYQSDTISVDLTEYKDTQQMSFFLNAIPSVESIRYFSEKISTIFESEPVVEVFSEIIVSDGDGAADIDSVYWWAPDLDLRLPFQKTVRVDSMAFRLRQSELTQHSLQKLIEKPAYIIIKDKPGYRGTYGPCFLGRIIEITPVTEEPGDQQTAIQPVFFRWEEANVPYEFSYEICLYRQQSGLQTLIYEKTGISRESTSFGFSQILPTGIYFWTLAIRDELNNMSRSQEAVFRIQ